MQKVQKTQKYTTFNGTFGNVGHAASEEMVIQLLTAKRLLVLFYEYRSMPY